VSGGPRAIEVSRLIGLAEFALRAGHLDRARRALDLAERQELDLLRLSLAQARLAILEGRADEAIGMLRTARDVDPFDEPAADLLGQMLLASADHDEALDCLLDAQVLGSGAQEAEDPAYEDGIGIAREALGMSADDVQARKLERVQRLEELALEAEEAAEAPQRVEEPTGAPSDVPLRDVLRDVAPFTQLDDAELRLLECAVDRVRVPKGSPVFREGQPSEDLYVVESGQIMIQRNTPFGRQVLATVPADRLFGEMNFIDGLSRSADAVAEEDAILLRISHAGLREIFSVEPKLALMFMREFWRGLADKVREGNELLKSFFKEESAAADGSAAPKAQKAAGKSSDVASQAKSDVLHEKGLTAAELQVLSEHAEALNFDSEAVIFREGDIGQSLYIVIQGKVRIEKHIPGVGQEALAILERGEFFGEMAVVDRAPRSASAIAHAPDTTVLTLEKSDIDALLERGGEGAHELMRILCRLLSQRLREINDKIVQWRFMSGGF